MKTIEKNSFSYLNLENRRSKHHSIPSTTCLPLEGDAGRQREEFPTTLKNSSPLIPLQRGTSKSNSLLIFFFIGAIIFSFSNNLSAQGCEGNLGINIFTEGDFGSGPSAISPDNRDIAPGYDFITDPPPNDGEYIITNNTAPWGDFASNWIDIQDNSPDPQGYMMVVNASNNPGLFYEQEIDGLCENTLFEFSADIINLIEPRLSAGSLPNISFLIDGVVAFNSGNIPNDATWVTKSFTFSTDPGQTSVLLSLRNNAPGGAGNDLALDNISFRACGPEALILPTEVEQICEDGNPIELIATIIGDQYPDLAIQWQTSLDGVNDWQDLPGENDTTYTHTIVSPGSYFYRYLLANGASNLSNEKCRVISNIKEVFVQPKLYFFTDTICEGLSYNFDGQQLDKSGIYMDSLLSQIGCDSFVTLDLTILPDPRIDVDFTPTDPTCLDSKNGSIVINQINNAAGPFQFFVNDTLLPNSLLTSGLGAGIYNLRIEDRYGCIWEDVVDLGSATSFSIDLGSDLVIELGETVTINVQASDIIDNCEWTTSNNTDSLLDCDMISFQPSSSMQLSLEATSEAGCIDSDEVNIEVLTVRKIYIPDAFSPDNNGINDFLVIYGSFPNVQMIQNFKVYDRWGGLMFEKGNFLPNDPTNGWDGSFRGKPVDAGIYTYFAEVLFIDGVVEVYSGDVTVFGVD